MTLIAVEIVEYDPEDGDTYPSVCDTEDTVQERFSFTGGERLVFDSSGNYLGQLVKSIGG